MAQALSKTAAIREASKHVSISGRGTSWHIYGPYRASEPSGPSTEHHADSYTKAVRIRAAWRAEIALHYMGALTEDASYAVDYAANGAAWPTSNMRELLEIGLKA